MLLATNLSYARMFGLNFMKTIPTIMVGIALSPWKESKARRITWHKVLTIISYLYHPCMLQLATLYCNELGNHAILLSASTCDVTTPYGISRTIHFISKSKTTTDIDIEVRRAQPSSTCLVNHPPQDDYLWPQYNYVKAKLKYTERTHNLFWPWSSTASPRLNYLQLHITHITKQPSGHAKYPKVTMLNP